MLNTEDKILDATIELLDNEGFNGATTKKIASTAGVNEVTVFRKFKNKKRLLRAAKERGANQFLEELETLFDIDEEEDVETYLMTLWNNASKKIDKRINLMRISMEEVRGIPIEEKVFPKVSRLINQNLTQYFQKLINNGIMKDIDPEAAAMTMFSIVCQITIYGKIYEQYPEETMEKYMKDSLKIFLHGVLKNQSKDE
jgi:AcrR family transcriptional regulator